MQPIRVQYTKIDLKTFRKCIARGYMYIYIYILELGMHNFQNSSPVDAQIKRPYSITYLFKKKIKNTNKNAKKKIKNVCLDHGVAINYSYIDNICALTRPLCICV